MLKEERVYKLYAVYNVLCGEGSGVLEKEGDRNLREIEFGLSNQLKIVYNTETLLNLPNERPDIMFLSSSSCVLRPATSTQVFLGFPVSISKC